MGEPHASIYRSSILRENPHIDYVAYLDVEETLLGLVSGTPPENIHGLATLEQSDISENPERRFIDDLDKLPFPTYGGFDIGAYPYKIMSIITSRGCPYQCTYCPVEAAIGRRYRTRSPENVFEEIKFWHMRGYREFWIQDDNFTLIPRRVDCLLELILNSGLKELRFALPNGVRSDKVPMELLIKMKRAGFFQIAFGVESASNRGLSNLNTNERVEDIAKGIENSLSAGIKVSLFFLVGSP